jgi:hypothetical protein
MFGLFAAFFIALFVTAGVSALVGHILLVEALVRPRPLDPREPNRSPVETAEPVRWREAA